MARPRSLIQRTPLSFYIDLTLPSRLDAWQRDKRLNPHGATPARAVEAFLTALCDGRFVLTALDPTGQRFTVTSQPVDTPESPTPITIDINFTMTLNPDGSYTLTHKKDSE